MMYYTHLAFGFLLSLIFVDLINVENKILFILIVVFFSIFPDIDETRSKISKEIKIVSRIINFIFGHRKFIHTIYLPILFFILFNLINFEIAVAALIGYFSHLFMDAITKQGIKPFYPLYNKRINGPFKTNSFLEKIIFLVIIVLSIYLLVLG